MICNLCRKTVFMSSDDFLGNSLLPFQHNWWQLVMANHLKSTHPSTWEKLSSARDSKNHSLRIKRQSRGKQLKLRRRNDGQSKVFKNGFTTTLLQFLNDSEGRSKKKEQ